MCVQDIDSLPVANSTICRCVELMLVILIEINVHIKQGVRASIYKYV